MATTVTSNKNISDITTNSNDMRKGPSKGKKNRTNEKKRINPKQPKRRVQRILKAREPQLVEFSKRSLFIKGMNANQEITNVMKDLHKLKQPDSIMMTRKNEILPFEDENSLEFLMKKNESSLFCYASHNKKRPNNLIFGRSFDDHILDMFEVGVKKYQSLMDFRKNPSKAIGSKPALLFLGDGWINEPSLGRLKSLFLDFFRGVEVSSISLRGLDHVMMFAVSDDDIEGSLANIPGLQLDKMALSQRSTSKRAVYIRNYTLQYPLSGIPVGQAPKQIHLTPMGPHLDLELRRSRMAPSDLWKKAIKQPAALRPKKVKNESTNVFGDTVGRIHVGKQDLDSMKVRRVKALRSNLNAGDVGKGLKVEKGSAYSSVEELTDGDFDEDDEGMEMEDANASDNGSSVYDSYDEVSEEEDESEEEED